MSSISEPNTGFVALGNAILIGIIGYFSYYSVSINKDEYDFSYSLPVKYQTVAVIINLNSTVLNTDNINQS